MKLFSRITGPIAAVAAILGVVLWFLWPLVAPHDPRSGSIAVQDVSKAETLKLGGDLGYGDTHSMTIRVKGQIGGTATVSNPLAYPSHTLTTIGGNVDLEWSGDYYTDATEVRYAPQQVRSGSLTVEYRFHRIP